MDGLFYSLQIFFAVFNIFSFLEISIIAVFIGIAYVMSHKREHHKRVYAPQISVIIPAYNEEAKIAGCLDALFESDYDLRLLEILCIDDLSTDRTREILDKYQKRYKQIRVLSGTHTGKAAAQNLGIQEAHSELVLLLDADVLVDRQYVRHIVAPFQQKNISYTFGMHCIDSPSNLLMHYQQLEFGYFNLVRWAFTTFTRYPQWFNGAAVCIRRSVLMQLGGFNNNTLSEDLDLMLTLYKGGFSPAVVRNAYTYTPAMGSFRSLIKQRMRWQYGIFQNFVRHARIFFFDRSVIYFAYFSLLLWISFTLLFMPFLLYSFLTAIVTSPFRLATVGVNFMTILGSLGSLHAGNHQVLQFAFAPNSSLLFFLLLAVSSLFNRQKNFLAVLAFITFPVYVLTIRVSLLFSFFRYRFNKTHTFIA